MTCPICKGKKESFGIGCGSQGCKPMRMRCFQCKGTGEITKEMMKWIETGKEIREARLKRDISSREEAKRLNMLPSAYSDIESGRVENSKWHPVMLRLFPIKRDT